MTFLAVHYKEDRLLGTGRDRSEDLFLLPESGEILEWQVRHLDLVGGDFPDYLASDLGCRLCSERMRFVLEGHATTIDVLQWLPVEVSTSQAVRQYSLLHFPEPPDVLAKRTVRRGAMVVKPVVDASKASGHSVFTYPGAGGIRMVVDSRVGDALAAANCTGLECVPIATDWE